MPPVGKIASLPDEMRAWLHQAIVARSFGDIVGLTEDLNALCKAGGVAITIGKSAVGVEAQRYKRAQAAIRATTEAMKLIADTSADDMDKRGEALNAKITTDMFETLFDAMEAGAVDDPLDRLAMLNKASLSAARLTTTSVRQRKHRAEVEDRARAAADKVTKLARQGGMSEATVAEIRASILGIPNRSAAPAAATSSAASPAAPAA